MEVVAAGRKKELVVDAGLVDGQRRGDVGGEGLSSRMMGASLVAGGRVGDGKVGEDPSRLGRLWEDELGTGWLESGSLRLKKDEIEGWFLDAEEEAFGAILIKIDS